MKVVEEFEAAVRDHAFIGSYDTASFVLAIQEEYDRAKAALIEALKRKEQK